MVFFAAGCNQKSNQKSNMVKINGHEISVETVRTQSERYKGLSGRDSLGENSGMLFVFPTADKYGFWMKDMRFPLDFIWIAAGKVVDIIPNVPAEPNVLDASLKIYKPAVAADQVLEVNAGWASKNSIKVGDSVILEKVSVDEF